MSSITNNFSYFVNPDTGQALYNGFIYFGLPDTDGRILSNQVQVTVLQEDGKLIKIPQPIKTNGSGVAVFLGSPIRINISNAIFSVFITDNLESLLYSRERASFGLPNPTGSAGKYLTNDGTIVEWGNSLPDQAGESGKFITTNGTVASWGEALPPQAGQESKSLMTDGTNDSWENLIPDQTGNEGKVLSTDGTSTLWRYIYFRPLLLSDSDLVHTFNDVVFPANGRVLVSVYGFSTYSHTSASAGGAVTLSANVSGSTLTNDAIINILSGSAPFENTLTAIRTVIITGTPGSIQNIVTSITFDIPAGIVGQFENTNHITTIVEG